MRPYFEYSTRPNTRNHSLVLLHHRKKVRYYTCATYVHAGAEIQVDQPREAGEAGHEAGVGEWAGAQLQPLQARMPRRQPVEAAVLHPGALVEAQLSQVGRCDAALKRPRGHGGGAQVQTK